MSSNKKETKAPAQVIKLLHTKAEAAAMLSVSLRTIDTLIALKKLPVCRIGRRVLIPHAALVNFIRRDHLTEAAA